jgi:hypothetical protein
MNQAKVVGPGEKLLSKDEVERLYRLAYTVDHEFFQKQDLIDLGLDLHRLKEFGEVRMSKSLSQVRKQVPALWKRMNDLQKAAYIMGDVMSGLKYLDNAIRELEKLLGEIPHAHDGISFIETGLFARIPAHLRDRLSKGFAKWKGNGDA